MIVEAVFVKLWKADVITESDVGVIYMNVHDAVLAAVERDATLYEQVSNAVLCVS